MSLQALELLAFVVAAAALYALIRYGRRARYRPLPGPPGYPIVGNMFDIPREAPWMTYRQWSRDHGSDIISLKLLGTTVTILNTADVAIQLLEKRSNVYSDRPRSVMLHDLAGWERNLAFQAYGDDWRAGRRTFHQYFNEKAVKEYKPQTSKYPRRLLLRLLDSPEDFLNHVRWMTGSSIMEITYGFEIQDEKDPFLILAEDAAQSVIQSGNAGSYLVDIFPLLKHIPAWFPGAQFHRQATAWRKAIIAGVETPMKAVKQAMAAGMANTSVTSTLLSEAGDPQAGEEYDFIEGVMGTAFVAGQDTTASTFLWFCFAMLKYPGIQRAAQEELDRIIGNDRLPELEDRDSLPFIDAILWEVLRWHPVTPLGIPHKLMTDDVYEGHHIPAGSIVVCNIWAISHDERVYPDPERFDPNRFLSPDSKLEKLRECVFGVGRRICPGRHLALQTLWLAMAHILAVFNIERPVDEHGNVIEPQFRFSTGVVSYPAPFRAKFSPRSETAEQLIRNIAIGDWNAPAATA